MDNEKELIVKAKKGDEAATIKVIARYTPIIWSQVDKMKYLKNSNEDDLRQAGVLGIMKSIHTYNPDKNSQVSTWMNTHIRKELQKCKMGEFLVKLTQYYYDKGARVTTEMYNEEYETHNTRTPLDNSFFEDDIKKTSDILIWLNRKYKKHYAEIFYKKHFEGASVRELSKEYKVSAKDILYRMHIAIKKAFDEKGEQKI